MIPDGHHDLGCQCWPHVSKAEADELRRERDAWRQLALNQADLMSRITRTVIEHKHVVTLDGRTLADAVRKYQLTYDRRNPGIDWHRPGPDDPITS